MVAKKVGVKSSVSPRSKKKAKPKAKKLVKFASPGMFEELSLVRREFIDLYIGDANLARFGPFSITNTLIDLEQP